MPPTRGHDLKPNMNSFCYEMDQDAPHTGARLETGLYSQPAISDAMPPTRGHDLKLVAAAAGALVGGDAPHTGARLETRHWNASRCN